MRKALKYLILILLTAAFVWYFARNLDWNEVTQNLRKANVWLLLAAAAIICLGYFLRSVRWQVLLKPLAPSNVGDLFATTTVGFTAIFLVGRAGEILRPMWLPMLDKRIRPSYAVITIGVERVFDLASLICFFSVSLIWFQTRVGHEAEYAYIRLVGNLMALGAVSFIVFLLIYSWRSEPLINWVAAFTDRKFIPERVRSIA